MQRDQPLELTRELLDDFYAECDELLTHLRAGWVQLEKAAAENVPAPAAVEALFRHMHSLKGISAIVGLRSAEQLAHACEDQLRALSQGKTQLQAETLESLIAATQRLTEIVSRHRQGKTLPETDDLLRRLRPAASTHSVPEDASFVGSATLPKSDPTAAARARGLRVCLAAFSPSPQLDARGVNVNAIRTRLQALGEILSATPSVRGPGSIVFEFMVGVREFPVELGAWEADGVRLTELPHRGPTVDAAKPPLVTEEKFAETLSLTPSHIVRVDLARLDELLRITGEMVILRSRLEERINLVGLGRDDLKEINLALTRSLREMREAITRVRLVPIAEIFTRMPFVVRDLARESEKKARMVLEGHQTEVDKYLVERLKEPLLHLVRNAFAHGVESPSERTAAGKSAEATILLRARSVGEFVVIQIRDDGRGIDAAAVAKKAAALGLTVPEHLDASGILKILCTPGFSTREEADLAAGRGVGMTVVANTVREMGGTFTLETTRGSGTEFTLKLPLTLSIADAIIVNVGPEICAVPQFAVDEIIQSDARELRRIQQTVVLPYRGSLLPIVRLTTLFRLPDTAADFLTLLVLSSERGAVGLVVDRVRGQREIVIRPLNDPLLRVPAISGATELGDGRPILILDPAAITQGVVRPPDLATTDSSPAETRAS